MTCTFVADETIQRYLDRDLSPGEARVLEDHLRDCALCQASVADLRWLYGGLGALPGWDPSPAFTEAVMEAVRPLYTPGFVRRAWLALRRWPVAAQGLAAVTGLASVGVSVWLLPRLLRGAVTMLSTGVFGFLGEGTQIVAAGGLSLLRLGEGVPLASLSYLGKLLTVGRVLAHAGETVALTPAGVGLLAVMVLFSGILVYLASQLRAPKGGYQHVRILA